MPPLEEDSFYIFITGFPILLYSKEFYSFTTLVLMELLVSIPLFTIMGFLKISNDPRKYNLSSRWMKINMLMLLIINWIGNYYENV